MVTKIQPIKDGKIDFRQLDGRIYQSNEMIYFINLQSGANERSFSMEPMNLFMNANYH
jgi:hypothetical protein